MKKPDLAGLNLLQQAQVLNNFLFEVQKKRDNVRGQIYRKKIKWEVFSHYSSGTPSCSCCGEQEIAFLALDHINGGGNKHRIEMTGKNGGGISTLLWVKRNNYPQGFQVLCFNCNIAKHTQKGCPHQKAVDKKWIV